MDAHSILADTSEPVELFPKELVRLEKAELPPSKRRSVFKRALRDLSIRLSIVTKSGFSGAKNISSPSWSASTEDVSGSRGPLVPEKDDPVMQLSPTVQGARRPFPQHSRPSRQSTAGKSSDTPPVSPLSRYATQQTPAGRPLHLTTYSRRTTLPHVQSDCSPLRHATPLQHAQSSITLRDDCKRSQHRRTNSNNAVKHNSGLNFRSSDPKLPNGDLQRIYDMHEASIRCYGRTPIEEARRERARQSLRLPTGAGHNRISAPSFSNLASSGMEVTIPKAGPGTQSRASNVVVESRRPASKEINAPEQFSPGRLGSSGDAPSSRSTVKETEYTSYDRIDINSLDTEGYTLLHKACIDRQTRAVELLLDAGADVRIKDRAGRTPLHLATLTRQKAIVEILLDQIPARSIPELWNSTILHDAVDTGDKGIMKILVQHGADINAEDKEGVSAVDYASSKGFTL